MRDCSADGGDRVTAQDAHGRRLATRISACRKTVRRIGKLRGALLCLSMVANLWIGTAHAADPAAASGKEVAERLQRGVDNPEREDNIYRRAEAVTSPEQVKANMRKLYSKLLVSVVGGQVDKAYNPHLRDAMFSAFNRAEMVEGRKRAGAIVTIWVPLFFDYCYLCINRFGTQSACDLCNIKRCPWVRPWPDTHRHRECCGPPAGNLFPVDTSVYSTFTTDSNFKACCVRKDQVRDTEELIACKSKNPLFNPLHAFKPRRGDGWAGLTEVDFWMNAIGMENSRGTTMIATQAEVQQCLNRSDQMMENANTASWVSGAIERNEKWAEKAGSDESGLTGPLPGSGDVSAKVQQDIKEVRPSGENKKLRFSDAIGEGGITARPNAAVMERSERRQLAGHFCFRPEQFYKLMNPLFDPLQRDGGPDWQALMNAKMLWTNYCPNGVELMTNPALSSIENVHRTSTDFQQGMKAWTQDPLYCQRIHATQNANFQYFGFDKVLESSQSGSGTPNAMAGGSTCMEGGNLNTGMVPVTFGRNSVVERRTAIADRLFGFLIAGTLIQQPSMMLPMRGPAITPFKSYLKGFEPRPYSLKGPQPPAFTHATFIGKQFVGGGTNELGEVCVRINGSDYQFQNRSDGLYLSDYTHKPFTQDFLFNSQKAGEVLNLDKAFNKYVQEWAKGDIQSQKQITRRDIDKNGSNMSDTSPDRKVHNYASTSRIVAVCPENYSRWRPPEDPWNAGLIKNLNEICREENFGSPVPHMAP